MRIITNDIFKLLFLCIIVWLETIFGKAIIEVVLMIFADKNIWYCLPIIASMTVDYKKQVIIIGIKLSM